MFKQSDILDEKKSKLLREKSKKILQISTKCYILNREFLKKQKHYKKITKRLQNY